MENNQYLKGNERLEDAIHILTENPDNEHMIAVLDIIQERMEEGGHFLIPVERVVEEAVDENDTPTYKLRTLTMEDGDEVLVAFTREDQSRHSMTTQIISNYIQPFLEMASQTDKASGLVINPWGESVYIPRELLQMLFEEGEEYESQVKFELGDITELAVECIVNAANSQLIGGSGVNGAIQRAAGPELLEECKTLGGCKTGEAKITKGYNLSADYVIHTVGPIYSASEDDPVLLSACYKNSLDLAMEHDIHSIAFPAISTGVYGYPPIEAASVALNSVFEWMDGHVEYPITVVFCSYDEETYEIYQEFIRQE